MKKIITYILIAAVLLSLSGCSYAGGISTFTAAVEKIPANFDPQIAESDEDLMVINNIFDGLFEIQNGEVVNNLAESCDISPDGKNYIIKLKTGNVFRCKGKMKDEFDGIPVTAADFVFAIERVLDPKTHSPYAGDFKNVRSVYAVDSNTLKIQLSNADYNFTEKLASPAAFPCNKDFFYKTGGAYGLTIDNILSNGPFRLNYLDTEGGNATIVRVEGKDKSIERIRLVKTEAGTQADSYSSEAISGYFAHSSQDTSYTNTSSISFDSGNISLVFNLSSPAFQNANIRKALGWYAFGFENSGANMAAVDPCGTIFPNTITLAGEYINSKILRSRPAYLGEDPKALLQAGFSELGISRLGSVTILMPNDSIYTLIYENINQLWQKNLGQFFAVEYLPTSQIKQRVESGNFDIAFYPLTPSNNTPYGILDMFTQYSIDLSYMVQTAKSMADQKDATTFISQAQNLIVDSAMAVPMGSEQTVFYYRNCFKNIYVDPFTKVINLKYATVN